MKYGGKYKMESKNIIRRTIISGLFSVILLSLLSVSFVNAEKTFFSSDELGEVIVNEKSAFESLFGSFFSIQVNPASPKVGERVSIEVGASIEFDESGIGLARFIISRDSFTIISEEFSSNLGCTGCTRPITFTFTPSKEGIYTVDYFINNANNDRVLAQETETFTVQQEVTECTNKNRCQGWVDLFLTNDGNGQRQQRACFTLTSGPPECNEQLRLEDRTECNSRFKIDASGVGCVPEGTSGQVICGDDIIQGTERCDGISLAGQTCQSQGFDSGTLSCSSSCTIFDLSQCIGDVGDGDGNGDITGEGKKLGERCAGVFGSCQEGLDCIKTDFLLFFTGGRCVSIGETGQFHFELRTEFGVDTCTPIKGSGINTCDPHGFSKNTECGEVFCAERQVCIDDACREDTSKTGNVRAIPESELKDKTKDELENSKCNKTTDCEEGAKCEPFDELPTKVQNRLSGGFFNLAEDGICIIEQDDGDFDLSSFPHFEITGDDTTDVLIQYGGGLFILVLLFRRS